MIDDFPDPLSPNMKCPWTEKLFKVNENAKVLPKTKRKIFHMFVIKGMFLCKRGRPDIQPAIAFLSTRVNRATEEDWKKLVRLMSFLKTTENDVLSLDANDTGTIEWYIDAAFAVHPDMKSHTGAIMTLGNGAVQALSTKQKVNARSSTEAELVSVDDAISKVMWTKRFLQAQGFNVKTNVIYRDNQSSMKLEENGKASSGKRTRHFDIKYFHITDLIQRGEVQIKYCPTEDMIADYSTKPLVGAKLEAFRQQVMNLQKSSS